MSAPRSRPRPAPAPSVPEGPIRAFAHAIPILTVLRTWIDHGRGRWSARTLQNRTRQIEKLVWWLENVEGVAPALDALDRQRCRSFIAYVREANETGRWGSSQPAAKREARPATVETAFNALRTFLHFVVEEGYFHYSPLKGVAKPSVPEDQIQPLSPAQLRALVDAARRSPTPERDVAIVLMLVDTGLWVSELCNLKIGDVNRATGEVRVLGKGNKIRQVYLGANARRALWRYIEQRHWDVGPEEPIFCAEGGTARGNPLQRTGALQLIRRLGRAAGITGVRCSPHTLRHSFALTFLRSGGNVLELQRLLGHKDQKIVNRYVALAQTDLAAAHRSASPADRLHLR